jgi:hypothetical protein
VRFAISRPSSSVVRELVEELHRRFVPEFLSTTR